MTDTTQDNLLIGSLVTAPAWAPWLSTFNEILTSATLVLGVVIGVVKLWGMVKR